MTDEAAGVQANRGPRCGGLGSLLSTLRQLCAQDKRASAEAEPIDTRNGAESQPGHGLPLPRGLRELLASPLAVWRSGGFVAATRQWFE